MDRARIGALVKGALLAVAAGGGLSACASVTPAPAGFSAAALSPSPAYAQPSRPQQGGRYKIGAPYQAAGVWYVPAQQPNYDEEGLGSWYGDAFNGKPTADGELFDMDGVSAAHATLPLPCIAQVTNLENGKSITLRINDRGPFHPGRIIDLSRGAAKALGYYQKGTARVRVRFVALAPFGGADQPQLASAAEMHGLAPLDPPPQVPTPSGAAGFLVQVGAFTERANAERAAARVTRAGRPRVEPLDRNGARLYRVTVAGDWRDAETAGAARTRVADLGFTDAKVIAGS